MRCEEVVRQHLDALGSRFSCSERDGRLWVVSLYSYPDGDLVEVSIRELASGEAAVTDLGETLRHLATHGFDPRTTSRGQYLLGEIVKQHDVQLERGMLTKRVPALEVGAALQDVLTASLAASHLLFLSRGYSPATFLEEVGQFVAERGINVVPHHYEIGQVTQKKYPIDMYVPGRERDGLIQALSPTTRAGSIPMVNATFRLWSDVPNGRWRATVLDDRLVEWRFEDLVLLRGVSDVYSWTHPGDFEKALLQVGGSRVLDSESLPEINGQS
jgi:hypothetical protein